MKNALIDPARNNRIVQIEDNPFDVAPPLTWVACADNVTTEWTYGGGVFVQPAGPPPVPVVIPTVVSMRQARLALLQGGLLTTVNTAIETGSEADIITWEYATEVNRADTLVANLATGLGLSETDLDNLFLLASTL